jgi:hypothetical protein
MDTNDVVVIGAVSTDPDVASLQALDTTTQGVLPHAVN